MIDGAHFSIEVGALVRRWQECSTRMNFLRWIQFITQVSEKIDMGSLAGDYEPPIDHSYLYRFFFHVPALAEFDQPVDRIDIQLCQRDGRSLPQAEIVELLRGPAVSQTSLAEVCETRSLVPSAFWRRELPRGGYLGP